NPEKPCAGTPAQRDAAATRAKMQVLTVRAPCPQQSSNPRSIPHRSARRRTHARSALARAGRPGSHHRTCRTPQDATEANSRRHPEGRTEAAAVAVQERVEAHEV